MNISYTITDSKRETAKWKAEIRVNEKQIDIHFNEDKTINKPFEINIPFPLVEFSKVIKEISKELNNMDE